MQPEIVNRVAASPLITFKVEDHYPAGPRMAVDLAPVLFQGAMLREKDLREFARTHDWAQYQDAYVAVHCTADAIVQTWAYMLIATRLLPHARHVAAGTMAELDHALMLQAFDKIDFAAYADRPVVIKGCSTLRLPESVYVELTRRLMPHAKSIAWGEPCSTVPLWKRP